MRKSRFWSWVWLALGAGYLLLPLYGTFDFSLRIRRDALSFDAYRNVFNDPQFFETFGFSIQMATATIVVSLLLIVPTAYWLHLKLPKWRPAVELVTLLPFVIPAIVLVFGFIKLYSRPLTIFSIQILPALTNTELTTNFLLIMGYTVLALPYMYRAVDTGLRTIDVRTLTEAAQSLGAGQATILFRVIFPNLRTAVLSGSLLTFAIVVGELTIATFLGRPAFAPYLWLMIQHRAFEPAALSIISFSLTWVAMVIIYLVTRGSGQGQVAGAH
jgi:putative spermidine/putrescine transport system permease protein